MAEGDTILRAARRIEAALGGQELRVRGSGRGQAGGVEQLSGHRLDRVETRGKHLLLHFGDLTLHSHLGMSGSWQVLRMGERRRKPASTIWVTLSGSRVEAVQFGGPTLRVLRTAQLRRDPMLARLGADVLAPDFDLAAAAEALSASPERELGDVLLDQRLVAGIGNIFKSESCFAARVNPWRRIGGLTDDELHRTLEAARRLMRESVARGRPSNAVYRRAGRPCRVCGTPISASGQGDANRRTYWCARCQSSEQ